ncbi:MAG: zinc-ribbon domain-containing protein [Candidatus Hodarchaeota archaeon]
MANYCHRCGLELREEARFCHSCGTERRVLESESSIQNSPPPLITPEIQAKSSLFDKMRKKIKDARKDGAAKIDSYLTSLEARDEISGVKLTEGRREFIRSRLIGLRERLAQGEDEFIQEEWQTLSVALESLPEDLIDEKCVICLKRVSGEPERPLAFCPHCLRGGHQEHLAEWIKIKGECPVCRQKALPSNLVRYRIPPAKA